MITSKNNRARWTKLFALALSAACTALACATPDDAPAEAADALRTDSEMQLVNVWTKHPYRMMDLLANRPPIAQAMTLSADHHLEAELWHDIVGASRPTCDRNEPSTCTVKVVGTWAVTTDPLAPEKPLVTFTLDRIDGVATSRSLVFAWQGVKSRAELTLTPLGDPQREEAFAGPAQCGNKPCTCGTEICTRDQDCMYTSDLFRTCVKKCTAGLRCFTEWAEAGVAVGFGGGGI